MIDIGTLFFEESALVLFSCLFLRQDLLCSPFIKFNDELICFLRIKTGEVSLLFRFECGKIN